MITRTTRKPASLYWAKPAMTENSRGGLGPPGLVVASMDCMLLPGFVPLTFLGRWLDRESMQAQRTVLPAFFRPAASLRFLHLAVNCMAMYWACRRLCPFWARASCCCLRWRQAAGRRRLFLLLLAPDAAYSVGGSPLVFALIGLLIPLRLLRPEAPTECWVRGGRLLLYYRC